MNRKILNNLRGHILETFGVNIQNTQIQTFKELIDYIDDEVTGRYFSSSSKIKLI